LTPTSHGLPEVSEVPSSAAIARALGLQPGDAVIRRRRVMAIEDQPVEIVDSYYPVDLARDTPLALPRKIRGGAVTALTDLGHRPASAREDISARPASAEEQELLATAADEWVLILVRLVIDSGNRPVEFSIMTMKARDRHLAYEVSL
jgi:DNA-binding GntR family transcriptional regulator